MAGKQTLLGKYGSSMDFSLVVDKDDLSKIKKKTQGAWFFPESSLVESLKDSSFSYNIDLYVPSDGVSVASDSKIKNEVIIPELRKMLSEELSKSFYFPIFGARDLTPETQEIVNGLTEKFASQIQSSRVGSGKYTFKVNNNPGSSPTISVSMPGSRESTITLNEKEKTLMKDVLDISLIRPDESISYTIAGKFPIPSWPGVHLKELWYRYLGQKPSSSSSYL